MIIFDLDGTLANCEHRRHFVDPSKRNDTVCWMKNSTKECWCYLDGVFNYKTKKLFKPDWKSFYEACDKDEPIESVINIYKHLVSKNQDVQIWGGRCESVRKKTEIWINKNLYVYGRDDFDKNIILKMRPIGDSTPDDELKELWLNELLTNNIAEKLKFAAEFNLTEATKPIDFVFDADPKSIQMWCRRGIFVFNCCQHDEEF